MVWILCTLSCVDILARLEETTLIAIMTEITKRAKKIYSIVVDEISMGGVIPST
jgi:hypothetical protein